MASPSGVEVPVLVDTNLGTHIAVAISPETPARDFKRRIESMHRNCFPNLGEIWVNGLMVKRKSFFYHLPESFPIKHAFQPLKGTWFIHAEAYAKNSSFLSGSVAAAEIEDCISNKGKVTDSLECRSCFTRISKNYSRCEGKRRTRRKKFLFVNVIFMKVLRAARFRNKNKRKKKKRRPRKTSFPNYSLNGVEKGYLDVKKVITSEERLSASSFASKSGSEFKEKGNSCPAEYTTSESDPESVSVSGIIKKYFTNYDELLLSCCEVTSSATRMISASRGKDKTFDNCLNIQVETRQQFLGKTPPRLGFQLPAHPTPGTSGKKFKRPEVGKRLVSASCSLGISASKQNPAISLCKFRDGGVPDLSFARRIVFEISDRDD